VGQDYFHTTNDEVDKNWYSNIGDDMVLSLEEYLTKSRYIDTRIGNKNIRRDIFALCFVLVILIGATIIFIRFKRLAPLYVDREKQLVYTWRGGRVLAQRYEDLQYLYHIQFLQVPLGFKPTRRGWGAKSIPKGGVAWMAFRIMPTGPYFNSFKDYEKVLAYMVQFMEYGREYVLPERTHWKRKIRDFLFYEDQRPADLKEQLQDILRRLDANRSLWLEDVKRFQEKGWSK